MLIYTSCLVCKTPMEITNGKKLRYCSVECRFSSFTEGFEKSEECWVWPKGGTSAGYGTFITCKDGKPQINYAHRESYRLFNGHIPAGYHVCHKCDNPKCFNPDHLFVGTAKDNAMDKERKGRGHDRSKCAKRGDEHPSRAKNYRLRRGETHPASKLTDEKVSNILSSEETCAKIAEEYGVSLALISQVRKRKIWRHVSPT